RNHAGNREVAVFHVLDPGADYYGFARAPAAGFSDLAGICGWAGVLGVCATERWVCTNLELAIAASEFAAECGRASGWHLRSSLWKFSAVGIGSLLQTGAQARRHGHGKSEERRVGKECRCRWESNH